MNKKKTSAAKKKSSNAKKATSAAGDKAKFSVDLSTLKLTKQEVAGLKNKFTKAAVTSAGKPKAAGRKKGEPYAKITFFKQTSPYAKVIFAQAL